MANESATTGNARLTDREYRVEIDRLKKELAERRQLELKLKETLHNLHVHQEELRTQNEDLVAAQREIADAHAKYLDLFDYAPNGYFIVSTDGLVSEVNLTAAKLLDRARNAILGKPLWLFVHKFARNQFQDYMRALWNDHSKSLELDLIRPDGSAVPVELHGVSMLNEDQPPCYCRIAAIDVTRRREAESALRQAHQWLDSILTTIPDIVYRLNESGTITYISRSIQNYGFRPEEFLNKSYLNLVHPEDRIKAHHRLNEKRKDGRHTKSLEIRLFNNNNGKPNQLQEVSDLFFSVNAVGLYTQDGNGGEKRYIGTQGIAHDITERKNSEAARNKLEEELQRVRRMEAVGRLAGGIAHNFNNLLMGVQGSVSLLRYRMKAMEDTDFLLDAVEECVQRGSDLTKRLLGFARGGKYIVKPTDLNTVLQSTFKMFNPTRKDIEIVQDLEPEIRLVQADQGQMEQVFLNLFINAGQAMPKGGRLRICTSNETPTKAQLQAGIGPKGDFIKIIVEDNGIGMSEETCSRIFEPFFSTKPDGRGTGLGLASVYGIIKNHGGTIKVQSKLGQGTTFEVLLPAYSNGRIDPVQTQSNHLEMGQGLILLVDDEKIVCEMLAEMLITLGYGVKIANDGTAAVSLYQSESKDIHAVILDIIMPGLSGLETYARLKSINPHVNVIFSSGFSPDEQIELILKNDRQKFIQKPFNLEEISKVLHSNH